jgi:hypothetical protein
MTMSTPRSWGKIEFPVSLIDDEIRGHLEREYEAQFDEDGSLKDWHGVDIEPGQVDGIFTLEDGEAAYGEFEDLEALLIKKGIPFDRESGMDWNRPPVRLVYRPAQGDKAALELNIDLDDDGDEVVSVKAIREILDRTDTEEGPEENIRDFLDFNFPAYSPLSDYVKEA